MLDLLRKIFLGQYPIAEQFKYARYPELPLLSLDLELTGLDTDIAKVTSIGWVQGLNFQVDLASAEYDVVRAKGDLAQSPVIHGLTAKDIALGRHIREKLQALEAFALSHVWVLHNAALDMRVLNRLWLQLELPAAKITTIDTMLLEVYMCEKAHGFVPKGAVALGNARKRYELNHTPLHNSLDDALATLTLLFAQLYALNKQGHMNLLELSHTRAIKTYCLG
ncbi:3'-5' exonuclease [Glaciecola sp. XM2]|jgi:DNA polymerase-3 subunit epsilon|uniref:3'-5' exonuclease n=1 Tax=Glaciecola sp. XM2 TaxID=1914931 RepID=UPI001BDDF15E|nr:3'-5' exonuclease [Glaciecola sp. XM2]MBT1450408.1 3'-5' exonuclease [Glaciecola sp. XM2]